MDLSDHVGGETENAEYRKIIGIDGEKPMNACGGISSCELRVQQSFTTESMGAKPLQGERSRL